MQKYIVKTTYKFNKTGETTTTTSHLISGLEKAQTQQQISKEWVKAHSHRFTFIKSEIIPQ